MKINRRTFLKGVGGALSLPLLESFGAIGSPTPTRFLVVGNPLGMHPDNFFPKTFGQDFIFPETLKSLEWLRRRMTVISHTDHGMVSGHGRELSFLNGILPETAAAYPEKNISIDNLIARRTGSRVRFPAINAALERGIRMSWNSNGVEIKPFTDPQKLFDHLFLNLSASERKTRRELIERNGSILDTVSDQLYSLRRNGTTADRIRLEQYETSVRELEGTFADRENWMDRNKPTYDISEHFKDYEVTVENRYNAIFDMIGYAFETDLTRVATIAFPNQLSYTDVDGVTRGYHACTHNGKKPEIIKELVNIESFQIAQLSRCLQKLDAIQEPNTEGTLLDHTVVLFGSGMGYGGTHSNRNLPIMVAGGGFKHRGHVNGRGTDGNNMPLCNLFVTIQQRFGIEKDIFNTSQGSFDLAHW